MFGKAKFTFNFYLLTCLNICLKFMNRLEEANSRKIKMDNIWYNLWIESLKFLVLINLRFSRNWCLLIIRNERLGWVYVWIPWGSKWRCITRFYGDLGKICLFAEVDLGFNPKRPNQIWASFGIEKSNIFTAKLLIFFSRTMFPQQQKCKIFFVCSQLLTSFDCTQWLK